MRIKINKKIKFILKESKSITFNEIIITNLLFITIKVLVFINISKECESRFKTFKTRIIRVFL